MNKRALIDLFETKLKDITSLTLDYHFNKGLDCPRIQFDVDDRMNTIKFRGNDCEMLLCNCDGDFFLTFNSIEVSVNSKEYHSLHKLFLKHLREKTNQLKKEKLERDKALLHKVLVKKAEDETRNILIEKTFLTPRFLRDFSQIRQK